MPKRTIHEDVQAALKRLNAKDPGLKQFLKKAHGYAVFPSVGKAALVIGGAYGRGEVYEQGKPIGYATIAQTTIGVQVGGDTFTELLVFESKESLDRFKRGRVAFAANASAVLVKAGAAGTADFEKGVAAFAYAQGGMLLEAAIGGQKFKFKPLDQEEQEDAGEEDAKAAKGGKRQMSFGDDEGEEESEGDEEQSGTLSKALQGVRSAGSKTTDLAKEHPVWATVIGTTLAAGVALVVVRALRKSGDTEGSRDEESEDQENQPEDQADDQADEQDEYDDEQEQDDDTERQDDDEEEEESPRYSRSRAR